MFKRFVPLVAAALYVLSAALNSGGTLPTPAEAQPISDIQRYVAGETLRDPNANRAMGLRAFVGCSAPNRVNLLLSWESPRYEFFSQVWVDLSANPNNFRPGTFFGRGPLLARQSIIEWDGLRPGQKHYARVNVLHGAGLPLPLQGYPFWATSDTVVFTTPPC